MTHEEKAIWYYNHNFNCSQSVFTAFAVELGIDEKTALMLGTNFGGGARKGEMCGAVSGALMVLGLKYGHCESENSESKQFAYRVSENFMNRFIKKNSTVVCREILGYDITKADDMAVIKEKNLFRTLCPQIVSCAVQILEDIIAENK